MELTEYIKPESSGFEVFKQVSTKRFISILMVLLNSPNAFSSLNILR